MEQEVLLSQQIGSKWREAGNLYHLGRWAYSKEFWAESEDYFRQALTIGKHQKDYRSMALAYSYLPELVYRRGSYEDAYHLYQEAIEITEAYGEMLSRARLVFGMARLASEMGRIEEALDYAEKAYDLYSHLAIRDMLQECVQLIEDLHKRYGR